MSAAETHSDPSETFPLPWTHEEVVIRRRWEVASILNDVLIGVWFLVGSVLFLRQSTTLAGTWLFVVGSAQMLARPTIRLGRHVHLTRRAQRGKTSP